MMSPARQNPAGERHIALGAGIQVFRIQAAFTHIMNQLEATKRTNKYKAGIGSKNKRSLPRIV